MAAQDGDIALVGDGFESIRGEESIRQRITQRLRFRRGEYFLDIRLGVPYLTDILGRRFDEGIARRVITRTIESVDGVISVESVETRFDQYSRKFTYNAKVQTEVGTITITN